MSDNFEFHMWKAHVGHDIVIYSYDTVNPSFVAIGCNDCKMNVEVWEYQEEYENESL